MKALRKVAQVFSMIVLMGGMSVASAHAQKPLLIAHVPFAFGVGGSILPAGEYNLERFGQSQFLWLVRGDKAGVVAFAWVDGSNQQAETPKLVFNRYGDTYFLSQIGLFGETYKLPTSNTERGLERDMARNNYNLKSVYIQASLR